MEDKNQQPLVPDMLYRHGQPEAAEPESLPLEAVFFSETPDPEGLPVPVPGQEAAASPEEDVSAPAEMPLPAAEEMIPADEALDVPPLPLFPDPEEPADQPAPAEEPTPDPLAVFIPEGEVAFSEEPAASPLEDTIPPTIPQPEPEAYLPICDDDTLAWLTGEDIIPPAAPSAAIYETAEPEVQAQMPAAVFPDHAEPEFNDMFIDRTGEEEPPPTKKKATPPVRKGRPKRKKGSGFLGIPHLIATLIWLAIIVAIGSSLGKLLWVGAADVLAFGRESEMVTVTIVDSDTIDTIAAKLQEVGLVKYPELFKFYAKLTGDDEEITTGTFELNTNLDYHALTNALSPSSSSRTVVKVTIPEGYSCRQVFNLLANSNVCSVESLEEYAANGELNEYWFLEGVERGDKYCLEGFLFPDTYEFYVNSTPREVLNKMLAGFNTRFSDEMRAQIDTLNTRISDMMRSNGKTEEQIANCLFTVREVLIVASLVEEETAGTAESANIASVVYNRLFNWGSNPAYLNFDSTLVYAQDGDASSINTGIDSPYNTYKNTGLTPTPITNPGLASIKAALEPSGTAYYYFVYNPETGLHEFTSTYEDHQKLVDQLGY